MRDLCGGVSKVYRKVCMNRHAACVKIRVYALVCAFASRRRFVCCVYCEYVSFVGVAYDRICHVPCDNSVCKWCIFLGY